MASIKKRPNGTYQATIYIGRDADGKQLFKYVTKDGLKECKDAAREIEQELVDGKLTKIPNMKLAAWVTQWMEINQGRLSPSTFALYRTYEKNHWSELGGYKLSQLTEPQINKFMNNKLKELSRASVRRMMSAFRIILKDALKHKSPARDIKLPIEENNKPYVLTDTEMAKIHDHVRGTKDEPIILLAAWCGLRRGEIFALKWNDIDWNAGELTVDESYCIDEDCKYLDKRPKSENGVRTVLVPGYLLGLLVELKKKEFAVVVKKKSVRQDQKVGQDKPGEKKTEEHRIFNTRPDSFSSYFAEMVRENKLPKIRFHDLRHYHASWLYARNIPDQRAAELLGHDIKVLKGVYQHLGLDRRIEIDDKIRQLNADKK